MPEPPKATTGRAYTPPVPIFTSWIDPQTGSSVEGYQITTTWLATGHLLTVRIPQTSYTVDNVDAAIRAAGAQDSAIAALGG